MNQLTFIVDNLPCLLIGCSGQRPGGLLMSIILAAVSIAGGFGLGHLVAVGYRAERCAIRWFCYLYVQVFRGLPLLLLVLLVYQIVGSLRFGMRLDAMSAALISLILYSSAYQAEITRAGLESMPPQLQETAAVLGAARWRISIYVHLVYVIRTMLPAYVGQAISLFKDTSIVLVIGVSDLMMSARIVLGSNVNNAPYWVATYLTVGFLYFGVAFLLSRLAHRIEKRNYVSGSLYASINYQ